MPIGTLVFFLNLIRRNNSTAKFSAKTWIEAVVIIAAIASAVISTCAPLTAAQSIQVWFSPDNDTYDFSTLFTKPDEWTKARSYINVFQFGPQQIGGVNTTGHNTITDLTRVNAFRALHSWGIDIAISAPAIKPWDCEGNKALSTTLKLVKNIAIAGGVTRFIAMDEPMVGGMVSCKQNLEEAAARTAAYMKGLNAAAPELVIGDTVVYPFYPVSQIEDWIKAVEKNGVKLAFVQLDVNIHRLDLDHRFDMARDFQRLKKVLADRKIGFGIIFWSGYNPQNSDRKYFDRTMAWVARVRASIGAPDQAIFESWIVRSSTTCKDTDLSCTMAKPKCAVSDPASCGQKSIPINLPENNPMVFSHTRLVNEAMGMLLKSGTR